MIILNDVLQRLKDNGWSAYKLAKEHKISPSTLDRIRKGWSVSTDTIGTICELCHCQPGDIMRYEY